MDSSTKLNFFKHFITWGLLLLNNQWSLRTKYFTQRVSFDTWKVIYEKANTVQV